MSFKFIVFGLIVICSEGDVCRKLVANENTETAIGTVCVSKVAENNTLTYSMFEDNTFQMDEIVLWTGKDFSALPKSIFGCPDTRFFPHAISANHMRTVSVSVPKWEPLYLVSKVSVHDTLGPTGGGEKSDVWVEGESICVFEFAPGTLLLFPGPLVEPDERPQKPV